MRLTEEQKLDLKPIVDQFDEEWKQLEYARLEDVYSNDVRVFLDAIPYSHYRYRYRVSEESMNSEIGKRLCKHLSKEKAPSRFFKREMRKQFPYWIYQGHLSAFYYAVDHVKEWQIDSSRYHRAARSTMYIQCYDRIMRIIQEFNRASIFHVDIVSIYKGNIRPGLKEKCLLDPDGYDVQIPGSVIAGELGIGNDRLEDILIDILDNVIETKQLSTELIRGIMMSHRKRLYEHLGKVLIDERLDEEYRQRICENMVVGCMEAFQYFLQMIIEHNLIRFPSVRRAAATWIGFLGDGQTDPDRIEARHLRLMSYYLENGNAREYALLSNDPMEVYLSFWSSGFYDLNMVPNQIMKSVYNGDALQAKVACVYMYAIPWDDFRHQFGKVILTKYADDLSVIAGVMNHFMLNVSHEIWSALHYIGKGSAPRVFDERVYVDYKIYFDSIEECKTFYEILWQIYSKLGKSRMEFKPYIFHWDRMTLTVLSLLNCLAFCASAMKNEKEIARVAAELPKYDFGSRGNKSCLMSLLLAFPTTRKQKELLVEEIADKEYDTREAALILIKKISLKKNHYLQLENMLHYKCGDNRSDILQILYGMNDDWLCETIERLLRDKKEEKRIGGLDLILQLKRDEKRQETFEKALSLLDVMKRHTGKENILIKEIRNTKGIVSISDNQGAKLYDPEASYEPVFDEGYVKDCQETFIKWFPKTKYKTLKPSRLKGIFSWKKKCQEGKVLKKMDQLAYELRKEVYVDENGEKNLFGVDNIDSLNAMKVPPKKELLDEFYEKEIGSDAMLLRLQFLLERNILDEKEEKAYGKLIENLFGVSSKQRVELYNKNQISALIRYYEKSHEDKAGRQACAVYVECVLLKQPEDLFKEIEIWDKRGYIVGHQLVAISTLSNINMILGNIVYHCDWQVKEKVFPIHYAFAKKQHFAYYRRENGDGVYGEYIKEKASNELDYPRLTDYLHAYHRGVISKDYLYKVIFEVLDTQECLRTLSMCYIYQMEREFPTYCNGSNASWKIEDLENAVEEVLGYPISDGIREEDEKLLVWISKLYRELTDPMVETELLRGDSPTPYTWLIYNVLWISGAEKFIHILTALGKETLERSSYFNSEYDYHEKISKKRGLSHLLRVCMPTKEDTKEKLKELFEQSDVSVKRLVEASLYSPEWIQLVGEVLGWDGYEAGCYYFMVLSNENFDERLVGKIARYTRLSVEELKDGSVDVDWLCEVYKKLGKKHFETIYQAAKYISGGSKYIRARRYADAILGKLDEREVKEQIIAKRDLDLVMSYGLLPIEDEKQVLDRYLFLQQFLEESKQFDTWCFAGEKLAVKNSLINLAHSAGFQNHTSLMIRMERKIVESMASMFKPKEVGKIKVWLTVDKEGFCAFCCEKAGEILTFIPPLYEEDDYVKQLVKSKNQLKKQRVRMRRMLEDAMEYETDFMYEECQLLLNNPITHSLMSRLAVCVDGQYGFISKCGFEKMDVATCTLSEAVLLSPEKTVQIVHTFHLYKERQLPAFQKYLFEHRLKQPFKQVFRELYVKTEEEMEMKYSLRFAGNSIHTTKTFGCLKGRQWVVDEKIGLKKVYYKENIVALLYALADWYSPLDVEEPTIECVLFADRKTGVLLKIGKIPGVIYSEIMGDIDIAVSEAYASDVAPESSHSTMEMRRSIVEQTLSLYKLTNVTFTEHHALIKGTRGEYSIHLGSGVVQHIGGSMSGQLPVSAEQRRKVFLPFEDEDPKTVEVIARILFFAEDSNTTTLRCTCKRT